MDRSAAFALTVASSAVIAAQAPINSHLGRAVGTFQAAFVSFAVGTVALAVVVSFAGGFASIDLGGVRWYYLTGGLLGVVFVSTLLVTVRSLGASGILAAGLVGQMSASVAIDRFGWLGVERTAVTPFRMAGIALVAAGAWLVIRP
ncbi:MAG: bacterial/archaeal transporter family-2 protein [Gaiellales bacterium]|jgi:transporter family-2 protein|nr:bacterial/archaeal transporter family-2 protein [Gaiellales bacterium]